MIALNGMLSSENIFNVIGDSVRYFKRRYLQCDSINKIAAIKKSGRFCLAKILMVHNTMHYR